MPSDRTRLRFFEREKHANKHEMFRRGREEREEYA
jgi:hypothetical protein